jgi:hypothetical protein
MYAQGPYQVSHHTVPIARPAVRPPSGCSKIHEGVNRARLPRSSCPHWAGAAS